MATTPGGDEGLLIPIQFSLEEARAALAQLEAQARAAGVKIGEGVAQPATKGIGQLKTQMGQGREAAMFFTQALGEFGPQGRTAQIAVAGVAGAFLGGGGLLAALSLVQAGVRLVVDAWEEEERAAKAAAEQAKKLAEERARLNRDAVVFANDRVASLRAMVASFKETTAAEKAQAEVSAINAQLQMTAAGPHRQMLVLRLATAKALAEEVAKLEARKKAEEELLAFEERGLQVRVQAAAALSGVQKADSEEVSSWLKRKAEAHKAYIDDLFGQMNAKFGQQVPQPQYGEFGPVTPESLQLFQQFEAAQRQQIATMQQLEAVGMNTYASLSRSAVAAFGPMLTGSRAFTQAMKAKGGAMQATADLSAAAFAAILQNTLAATAQEAAVESLMSLARGLSYASTPGLQGFAAGQFAAAAQFAAVAGVAGAGAMVIGQTRGMTASEKAQVDAAGGTGAAPVGSGAREFGSSSGQVAGVHTRELIVVMGSPFETPQETARRAARTLQLAGELNMLPRD